MEWFRAIWASNHADHDRQGEDYYATDPIAIDLLFQQEEFVWPIREPACGEGHLSKRMEELWYEVISSDIIDRWYWYILDFLKYDGINKAGSFITNPPYKYAEEFIRKSLSLLDEWGKCAMFLKIQFLEGKKRKKLFEEYPPRVIYVSSSRIQCALWWDFENIWSTCMCHARYVREKWYKWDTVLKRIN